MLPLSLTLAAAACAPGGAGVGGELPPADPIPEAEAEAAFVDGMCSIYESCSCDLEFFAWDQPCSGAVRSEWERFQTDSQAFGLTYDAQCMGDLIARYDHHACAAHGTENDLACADLCKPYYGTKGYAESCNWGAYASGPGFALSSDDCDQDHTCLEGICLPTCWLMEGVPEGDLCYNDGFYLTCQAGLWCDSEGSRRCEPPLQPGDSCLNSGGASCGEGNYCDWDAGICRENPRVGESCDFSGECQADAFCDTNNGWVCEALAAFGESCGGHDQCETGYCPNGLCGTKPSPGQTCYGRCEGDLDCVDNVCVEAVAAVCAY